MGGREREDCEGFGDGRAYDFANRDEAAAAAREGRKPTRPPYKWSDESRAAKRKSRGA
jgi:hypothetical protein